VSSAPLSNKQYLIKAFDEGLKSTKFIFCVNVRLACLNNDAILLIILILVIVIITQHLQNDLKQYMIRNH